MMLETSKIPKDSETLQKIEEIPPKKDNPPLKSMEIENPTSVNTKASELKEFPVKLENPEIITIDFENPDSKTVEFENHCSDYPKNHETLIGCTEIIVKEGGEKFKETQITKTLDESLKAENSLLKIKNSSSDELGNPKDEDVKMEDAQLSDDLYSDVDDNILGEKIEGDIVPFIRGDQRCLKEKGRKEEEEEEYNWRHFQRPSYHSALFQCKDCGCEKMLYRDPFLEEPPCPCRYCCCDGDRIIIRDHSMRHGKKKDLMHEEEESEWNVSHSFYSNMDWFYSGSSSMTRPCREPESGPYPVGAGLVNLGNTCFLNSIIQCFTHTVVLVQELLSLKHEASSHGFGEFCVLCAVRDQMEHSFVKSVPAIEPINFVDNLSNISSSFRKHQQEDAHEFLQCLLDKLDQNWLKYETTAVDAIDSSSPSNTLVQRIFGGRLVSQVRCCKCDHCSDTPEPIIDLSLEIGEADSLERALKSFTKVETLEDAEMFRCGSCKELVKAEKQLMLDQAPSVAALHLKRFKSDGINVEKIDKMVEYPLELDLATYTKGSNDGNEDLKYDLFAFVVHVGSAPTSGHYFCYIRTSLEEWYRFDDSKVTRVSKEIALREEAYILFYTKKGTPWFGTLLDKWKGKCHERFSSTSPKSVLHAMDLPSTSNPVASTMCDKFSAFPSELRLHEIEIKAGVGMDKVGSMAGVDARESSIVNPISATSLSVPSKKHEFKIDEAELDDTRFFMEEKGANKGKTCYKTVGEVELVSGKILGTRSHADDSFDCIEPATPVRAQSQTQFFEGKPAEEAYEIPRNHLKTKHRSSSSVPAKKSSMNMSKQDMKRKEAAKLCKSMPGGRGSFFMNFVSLSSNNTSSRKRRHQASVSHHRYESSKKRVRVSPKRILRPLTA